MLNSVEFDAVYNINVQVQRIFVQRTLKGENYGKEKFLVLNKNQFPNGLVWNKNSTAGEGGADFTATWLIHIIYHSLFNYILIRIYICKK